MKTKKDMENHLQLVYLAIKHKEVEFEGTCRFTEESQFVYPKDVDYVIKHIYVYDRYHNMFEFTITREDDTQPLCDIRDYKSTTIYQKELIFTNFKGTIKGTSIELTLEEMNAFMLEGIKNEEDRSIIDLVS